MKGSGLLAIAACAVAGLAGLILLSFAIHLVLLSSDRFNWLEAPKPGH